MAQFRLLLAPHDGWHGFEENDVIAVTDATKPLGAREQHFGQAIIESDEDIRVLRQRYEHPLDACRTCQMLLPVRWPELHKHQVDDLREISISEINGTFQVDEPFVTSTSGALGTILEVRVSSLLVRLDHEAMIDPWHDEMIIGDDSSADALVDITRPLEGQLLRVKERQWCWDADAEQLVDKQPGTGLPWLSDAAKRAYHPFTLYKQATGQDHPQLGLEPEFDPPPE